MPQTRKDDQTIFTARVFGSELPARVENIVLCFFVQAIRYASDFVASPPASQNPALFYGTPI